jgi:fimbrial isopeptide formation D2 family protein/LPXTG-motif cell wall-anchored protein
MKGLKKLLTGILAATLIMGSSLTVCAENGGAGATESTEQTATITITPQKAIIDQAKTDKNLKITYTYYQILRATAAPKEAKDSFSAISYYLYTETDEDLKKALEDTGWFTATLSADGSRWIMTSSATEEDAEDLRDDLNTDDIKKYAIKSDTFFYDSSKDIEKAVSGPLSIGYYLVESSLGSVVALQTIGDVAIEEKNESITTNKTVAKTNYSVGDKVEYKATVYIPETTELNSNVVLHDTMDDSLAFDANSVAAVAAKNGDDGSSFTAYKVNDKVTDGCTFEITIPVTTDVHGKTITFTYEAELKSEAADSDGFVNELFGENKNYKTKPTSPKVYSYGFKLEKLFEGASEDADFTADFEIRPTPTGDPIEFVKVGEGFDYRKAHSGDTQKTTTVTVKNNVESVFYGLAAGDYYLVETDTNAEGYNLLADAVVVTITANTTNPAEYTVSYKIGNGTEQTGTVTIENTKGTILPSTGGIGTTIFYIIGSLLIVAGVAYFIVRRKANAE